MRKKISLALVLIVIIVAVYFVFFPVKVANPAAPENVISNTVEN